MTNQEIIEKIYRVQMAAKAKNPQVANAIEKATLHLLEYQGEIENASKSELLAVKGVGKGIVDYIIMAAEGKSRYEILKAIPEPKKGRLGEMKWKW